MPDDGPNPLCAVILTAISIEYKAIRAHLTNLHQEVHSSGTIYERGNFTANGKIWDVLIVETGVGITKAAVETIHAVEYFKPSLILFVGVAGGLKDVKLGDVVAATKVYGYESGKSDPIFRPRPDVRSSTHRMEHRARAEAKSGDWVKRLKETFPDPALMPRVYIAPIASGNQVAASTNSAVLGLLRSNYSDALAVEMEGYGFLEAVHAYPNIDALIIRGISDLIDDKADADTHNYQEVAARHASAFAFEVLAKLDVPEIKYGSQVIQTSMVYEDQDLPKAQSLLKYKNYLESIRDEFLYKRNLREITENDIDMWERKLREIVMGIEILQRKYDLSGYLRSVPKIQAIIWNAIVNLYLASDILQKRSTTRDREVLYRKLKECPNILSGAIELFRIEAID